MSRVDSPAISPTPRIVVKVDVVVMKAAAKVGKKNGIHRNAVLITALPTVSLASCARPTVTGRDYGPGLWFATITPPMAQLWAGCSHPLRSSDVTTLSKRAKQELDRALAEIPATIERSPHSSHVHEVAARAYRHIDDDRWRGHCDQAIELLISDMQAQSQPRPSLDLVRVLQWAGEHERAASHLAQIVTADETERARRPERPVDFDEFIALLLAGELPRLVELGRASLDPTKDYLPNRIVRLVEADLDGDRRTRDAIAKSIIDAPGGDLNQMHWYRALSDQMVSRTRFGRSSALPPHPPMPRAQTDYDSYRAQLGDDEHLTQIRAAQADQPVNAATLLRHAAELEAALTTPKPHNARDMLRLAALHRMAGDSGSSDQLLVELTHRESVEPEHLAEALLFLGRHEELQAVVTATKGDGIHQAVVAFARIDAGEQDAGFDDLRRFADKYSPSAPLGVYPAEVLSLAIERFS